MYADDLILLSISLHDLQCLINICLKEFQSIGMEININKSACMRIGNRHNVFAPPLTVNKLQLQWKKDICYLGLKLVAAKKFTVNLQPIKQKFYRALNSILGKVGLNTSPTVLCSLIESFCVSVLLYAAESIVWNKEMLKSFESAYSHAFMKIFKTFDITVVKQCQFYMGYLPIELKIVSKKITFLTKMLKSNIFILKYLCNVNNELMELLNK
jgi:hypothetical protein